MAHWADISSYSRDEARVPKSYLLEGFPGPKTVITRHIRELPMAPPSSQFAREKLINAIIFFAKNTEHCQKTKLFKLLSFLDFEIYSKTGRTVTGLTYSAFPMGPVPVRLHEELKNRPAPDLATQVLIRTIAADHDSLGGMTFTPRHEFEAKWFTKRELKTLENLAVIFHDTTAEQMVLAAHDRGGPWYRVWKVEKNQLAPIPFRYALAAPGSISEDEASEIEAEADEVRQIFGV
jgi:hypothetical protein